MADTDTTQTLTLDFGNGAPSAVRPCCNDVQGEWTVNPRPTLDRLEYLGPGGVTTTYYFSVIPKGYRISARVRAHGRLIGTLECKCMDDGRTMSETEADEPFSVDTTIPVFSQNLLKKLIPGIGWVMLAVDVARAARQAYEIYQLTPELSAQILENAAPAVERAVEEMINSATSLCQNKHSQRCPPPEPAPYEGVPMV